MAHLKTTSLLQEPLARLCASVFVIQLPRQSRCSVFFPSMICVCESAIDTKETDGMQNPQNCMQDADNFTENADNPEQNKTEQNKANENRELPPLTPPPGEDVGVWRKYSFIEFPGYAYNKNTHNLECLLLALDGLHINDPNDTKAILKLSDYGRLGNEVWKIIHATKWSIVNSKGKYLIGALNKARTQG